MGQLRNQAEGLTASAGQLEERVNALAADESQRRDARAEIELRALVGEYSAERANAELATCDTEIGRLEAERGVAAGELHRIQEILALVRQPAGRPAAPAPSAPTFRPLGAAATQPEPDSTVDELAFLNSLVDKPDSAPPAPLPAPTAPAAAAPAPRIEDTPLITSLEERPDAQAGREGLTLRQATGTPQFLKGMPTEQVKTLKCQECGTMNYPTEWYCERCGGELAAM
jgi:hypothetical protein